MSDVVTTIDLGDERDFDADKTLKRIRHYIDHPPQNSRIFTVTPEIAEELLKFNTRNRPKKPKNISRYANDMASRNWPVTGDTIKFSDKKRLCDGQNRLMACVRAGVAFTTHFVFGIDDDAFDRLDQGRNRDGSDILHNAGYSNTNALAGAVRWAHLIDTDRAKQRDTFQPPEILRLVRERYPDLPPLIPQARQIYNNTNQPASMVAGLLYHFRKANAAKASEFALAWEMGNIAGKHRPLGIMQARITELKNSTSGRIHDVVRAALIVLAWNLFVQGRKGTKSVFIWDPAEPFPQIEG